MKADGSSQEIKPKLRLPNGPQGGGFLTLQVGDIGIAVEYGPAKIELLRVLNQALFADADLPELVRGWRSPETIAEQLSYPTAVGGIRRAVMLINRAFRRAIAEQAPHLAVPALIVTKRRIGIRLSWPLTLNSSDGWLGSQSDGEVNQA